MLSAAKNSTNLIASNRLHLGNGISPLSPREQPLSAVESQLEEGTSGIGDGGKTDENTLATVIESRAPSIRPDPQHTNNKRNKKRFKAHVKIATLNIRGKGSSLPLHENNKWNTINKLIRDKKIGILAVQESHLSSEDTEHINNIYGRRMALINSHDQQTPNAKGISIVINKELVNYSEVESKELITGRALLVTVTWKSKRKTKIAAVYAPNPPNENAEFWRSLNLIWQGDKDSKPDILMGDFNVVQEPEDRVPPHPDAAATVNALSSLILALDLIDGWREAFPNGKLYTYSQRATGSQSRIDRIYAKKSITPKAAEWNIESSGVKTDHSIASVKITDWDSPQIGRGRWTVPLFMLKDKRLLKKLNEEGRKLMGDIRTSATNRSHFQNPQKALWKYKCNVRNIIREHARTVIPKLDMQIKRLEDQITSMTVDINTNRETVGDNAADHAAIRDRLETLYQLKYSNAKETSAAKWRLEGEQIGKYWTKICKGHKPRDVIHALEKQSGTSNSLEKSSKRMATMMRDYHNNLQNETRGPPNEDCQRDLSRSMDAIQERLTERESERLNEIILYDEVQEALRTAKNGSAAGLDGLPYEFWKCLSSQYEKHRFDGANDVLDPIFALTEVYNDIEIHGVDPDTQFAEGWMCPLYKKNDRTKMENYRPITLLNTDYKLLTKALATKLAKAVSASIHENQAGFIPGRSIFDQIRLSKLMVEFAESQEVNGVIIALDQEKAYDKITHQYLWKTLSKFNIPKSFIDTIRELYKYAVTSVMVNGEISAPFSVTRGVRQGDPISCLLFVLAIEPLACMLRQSNLRGFNIPGRSERILTTLFADDTTVYLADEDDFTNLKEILDTWCSASGAKFNINKTMIIPIGSKDYRDAIIKSRKLNGSTETFPQNVNLTPDGTAIRMLGAYVGNNVPHIHKWNELISQVQADLKTWGKGCTTMNGRRLVTQMIVGGKTQFLTMAQGMPTRIEKLLIQIIRDFIWNGQKPMVKIETLYKPIEEGGIGLLDIKARNEAIQIMHMKNYTRMPGERPTWAYVADVIINKNIMMRSGTVEDSAKLNFTAQTWEANIKHPMPKLLSDMIKVGKKHNVTFSAIKLSEELKEQLPIWYHIGAPKQMNMLNNSSLSKCLRNKHRVHTVGDLMKQAGRAANTGTQSKHKRRRNCACIQCITDRTAGCKNPHKCCKAALRILNLLNEKWRPGDTAPEDGLTLTKRRTQVNLDADITEDEIIFDPTITTRGSIADGIRVFVDPDIGQCRPGHRPPRGATVVEEAVEVFTDGSCQRNGELSAAAGSGVYFGDGNRNNSSVKIPSTLPQSNQIGEIVAVIVAAQKTPPFAPLLIVSDSRYVIEGLTTHLKRWEERGWINVKNSYFFRTAAYHLRRRSAKTSFRWIKGHGNSIGNIMADRLADLAAKKTLEDALDLNIPDNFNLSGAKLSTLSQALAYLGIKERTWVSQRGAAMPALEETRDTARSLHNKSPTDATIWKSFRNKDITRATQDFFWKVTHNTYKIGEYWKNIPNFENREACQVCGCTESMKHIITECTAPGQELIWRKVNALWNRTSGKNFVPSWGSILSCALANFRDNQEKVLKGTNRLYRILISEAAHLIWRLRCERVITNGNNPRKYHSNKEIENRWYHAIDSRLRLDIEMSRPLFGRKTIKRALVRQTWENVMDKKSTILYNRRDVSGVLAGGAKLERPSVWREDSQVQAGTVPHRSVDPT